MSANPSNLTLGRVFIAHRSELRGLARKIVGGADEADDVLQDAYLKLVDGACARDVEKPYAYCCQVVRNMALDYRRRKSVEVAYCTQSDDGELPDVAGGFEPDDGVDERRLLEVVSDVLATLPPRTRLAFELHRVQGLTQRGIGEKLGISATMVNFLLKDAVQALAPCYDLYRQGRG
ncbi:RNA polymerase ECF family sigma factor [Bordetella ansorpii]|uniref:RNA polymerase ECF family sigma factor n=1 Tax=Bordetella ansorpii TaxID=288768 RepID=A0A157SVL1_9BORD|nr:sigma-70 family RNA polymerase sigma factor [Bordetella ansorpii]SAI74498.1 RNA polymerase ECF family sigma factor [Bordetella ansorpii]